VENVAGTALLETPMATRPSQAKQKHLFQVLVLLAVVSRNPDGLWRGVGKITATDLAEEVRAM
jgi:hypothetical protein